jgi:hypothetical protein
MMFLAPLTDPQTTAHKMGQCVNKSTFPIFSNCRSLGSRIKIMYTVLMLIPKNSNAEQCTENVSKLGFCGKYMGVVNVDFDLKPFL